MKIFERSDESGWGNRLNIVDENNVFVGYDYSQECCESFGYKIVLEEPKSVIDWDCVESIKIDPEKYVFDIDYFESLSGAEYDGGGAVSFRLTDINKNKIYLVLFNCHNGYYGHGFEMKVNEEMKREGCI